MSHPQMYPERASVSGELALTVVLPVCHGAATVRAQLDASVRR
jgi:hypothetical protein